MALQYHHYRTISQKKIFLIFILSHFHCPHQTFTSLPQSTLSPLPYGLLSLLSPKVYSLSCTLRSTLDLYLSSTVYSRPLPFLPRSTLDLYLSPTVYSRPLPSPTVYSGISLTVYSGPLPLSHGLLWTFTSFR